MLRVVVQPLVQKGTLGSGIFRNVKTRAPEHGQGNGSCEDDEGVPKTVELSGQHKEYEDDRQAERRDELVALGPELARFSGVVQNVAPWQNRGGLAFQKLQRLVQGADGHAADLDRVELLEAVQGAGRRGVFDGRDAAEGQEFVGGPR